MPVRVMEIKAPATMAVIDLHVLRRPRAAAIDQPFIADTIEDPVKVRFAYLEGVVMPLEAVPVVEIDGQRVVDPHGGEVRNRAIVFQTEDAGEKAGRFLLVPGGEDRVIEADGQGRPLMVPK